MITDRRSLERQLRQSQKMEAVGRLAGGIEHDFNNLLTVIRSQAEIVGMDMGSSSSLANEMALIQESADRAARLTTQLLAFSREQMLQPRIVDLNEILRDMEKLLVRTLGEHIEVRIELVDELAPIRVDPSRLEQVVMNLAVNARDAMEGGGTLRLSTAMEEPGARDAPTDPFEDAPSVVRLEVSDSGPGIPEEARGKIFEPFFTTKRARGGTSQRMSRSFRSPFHRPDS